MSKHADVTTDEFGVPTATPQPKVLAAAGGAGAGAALTTLIVYLIESLGNIDVPEGVENSALVLISIGLSFLAGYIKRPTGIS